MKARKDTWQKFINSLNSRTPTKVWDKFRKINENYKSRTIPPLERGGNIITSPEEIADHYANISRAFHKKIKPLKKQKEEEMPYNKPFTDRGRTENSKKTKNAALGEDIIRPRQ